jgi:hypothetical protein
MKIKIRLSKSDKKLDKLVSFMESLPNSRLCMEEVHEIETSNSSAENIENWLSEQRKIDYAEKMEEVDAEHSYSVEEITISR